MWGYPRACPEPLPDPLRLPDARTLKGGGRGGWNGRAPLTHKRHPPQPAQPQNAETTPAGAPAAAADRKQRPGAACERLPSPPRNLPATPRILPDPPCIAPGPCTQVAILTASVEAYASPVMDKVDYTRRWVHHRLFRDSCANFNGYYIKDLSYLGRPMHSIIIVDNCPTSYMFHLRNALPISSWFDDPADTELLALLQTLERVAHAEAVYPLLQEHRQAHAPEAAAQTRVDGPY